jgi:hypothetical protein
MSNFQGRYRRAYERLGHHLTQREGRSESRIRAVEKRLGVRLPDALRQYCLIAGAERRFNQAFNHLYAPTDWFIDAGRLVFMGENQAVVLWGTAARLQPDDDPTVYQGVNGESIEWYVEHERCSVFLLVMLRWQGTFGGAMNCSGSAAVSADLVNHLGRDWSFVGEVNQMRAYDRPGKAVCFLKWEDSFRVFAGAARTVDLDAIARELGLRWDN